MADTRTKYYAGIGSRETPKDIAKLMTEFASLAGESGWGLRSGAAQGADTAFEVGCDAVQGSKHIFLPWKGFNGNLSELYDDSCAQAYEVAAKIHPVWSRLSPAGKKLVARNMHQIMGPDFDDPVQFVMCWTPDGCESHTTYGRATGGTGTAICLASMQAIPIFNLANPNRLEEAMKLL